MKTNRSRTAGFTLVEIMIVAGIIGLLAAIAIPSFVRARTTAKQQNCVNNLRQIDDATQQWALEYKKTGTDPVTYADISEYMKSEAICPAGGTSFDDSYTIVDALTTPVCKQQPVTHALP